ncbi:MAG: FKBP-type peptidyl-prolyl cis-trans isomerase [Bacteroidetes bacterium]|nr:FKBP-type peptidyl-prolyl cis-trans isomerase [Bacteroidota bacterium]
MRNIVAVVLLAMVMTSCQSSGDKKTELTTQKDKVSYAIGLNIGANMVRDSLDLDYAVLLQGIKDAWLDTSKRMMNLEEVKQTLMTWQQEMQTKQTERQRAAGERNRLDGEKFLAENKKESGVVTLPSGLQYKVITAGKGPTPKADQIVVTNYVGTLVNGQEFDSSIKRGQPAEWQVTGVIAGWSEALQLMKVGSKWRLFVPANLAYGDQGAGEVIPPGSTLIFEIELLSIK